MAVASQIKCAGTTYDIGVMATTGTTTSNYYVLTKTAPTSATDKPVYSASVYMKNNVLYGACWNDYAEFRRINKDEVIPIPGSVVKENGDGSVSLVKKRLDKGCLIVSDTYGFAIGQTSENILPIAVAGRVLALPDKDASTFEIGAPVCSGENGTISMMTEEEERQYPSRIIGTVSEIPTYTIWHGNNDIPVNGRIWIKVK